MRFLVKVFKLQYTIEKKYDPSKPDLKFNKELGEMSSFGKKGPIFNVGLEKICS